jgi:hypothetical protein
MRKRALRCAGIGFVLIAALGCGEGEPPAARAPVATDSPGSAGDLGDDRQLSPDTLEGAGAWADDRRAVARHEAREARMAQGGQEAERRREDALRRMQERREAARRDRERYDTPEKLAVALQEGDPAVRSRATRRLDAEGEELNTLLSLMSEDPAPEVREAAARSLAAAEDPAAQEALISSLDDSDPDVVVAAIESLVFVGDETLIPTLEPYLQHKDEDVRLAAEDAIYHLR